MNAVRGKKEGLPMKAIRELTLTFARRGGGFLQRGRDLPMLMENVEKKKKRKKNAATKKLPSTGHQRRKTAPAQRAPVTYGVGGEGKGKEDRRSIKGRRQWQMKRKRLLRWKGRSKSMEVHLLELLKRGVDNNGSQEEKNPPGKITTYTAKRPRPTANRSGFPLLFDRRSRRKGRQMGQVRLQRSVRRG